MGKKILSETEHVVAIDQDFGGPYVVVTFNEQGSVRNALRFWGDALLLQQGISSFGIVTTKPNWYPRESMDAIITALRERIKDRKVLTIGQGHGGYGALKFSARLRASTALSFCPHWSIDPVDVASFDSRFASHFDKALHNGLRIEQEDLCPNAFVLFDRVQTLDSAHAHKLAALNGVKTVAASSYRQEAFLTEGRRSASLINLCVGDSAPTVRDIRRAIRPWRMQSKIYFNDMLRRLIKRMTHSRHRSSLFASRLIANTNDAGNPLYAALIGHLKGNRSLATEELGTATAEHYKSIDLIVLWQLTKEFRFVEAEEAIARHIREKQPGDTWACLCAAGTQLRLGKRDLARDELMRLAKHADAMGHLNQFVELAIRVRSPEVVEIINSDALPRLKKVPVLLRLIELYSRLGDRQNAYRRAMDLVKICGDSREDLRMATNCLVDLGELTSALEIRRRLMRESPDDCLLALDVLNVRSRMLAGKRNSGDISYYDMERKRIYSDLKQMMSAPALPCAAWERASHLYEILGDLDAALLSIQKALNGKDVGFEQRYRLAVLLGRKGRGRSARRELAALLREGTKGPNQLRMLGDLAVVLGDLPLALQFAEAQFQCEPTSPDCILYLAKHLRLAGDRGRAHRLVVSLFETERRGRFISDEQSIELARELYETGDVSLAKEASKEAAARNPENATVRELVASIRMMEKFAKVDTSVPERPKVAKNMRRNLATGILGIFRR